LQDNISFTFIGDSFIEGFGDIKNLGWCRRIINIIQNNNPSFQIDYYNLGLRGDTSSQILSRFTRETKTLQLNNKHNILILSFGTNDCISVGDTQRVTFKKSVDNLKNLIESSKEDFNEVLFITPPFLAIDELNDKLKTLIPLYIETLDTLNINYINLFELLKNNEPWIHDILSTDLVHPSDEGYEELTNLIYNHPNWSFK
jgi:lysophospholipase L1-like esterase